MTWQQVLVGALIALMLILQVLGLALSTEEFETPSSRKVGYIGFAFYWLLLVGALHSGGFW